MPQHCTIVKLTTVTEKEASSRLLFLELHVFMYYQAEKKKSLDKVLYIKLLKNPCILALIYHRYVQYGDQDETDLNTYMITFACNEMMSGSERRHSVQLGTR